MLMDSDSIKAPLSPTNNAARLVVNKRPEDETSERERANTLQSFNKYTSR